MVASNVEVPPRIAANCKVDARGYFIPWFVHHPPGGEPDFRIIGDGKIAAAVRFDKCWVCGQPRAKRAAFVIGPMCAVNRTSSEPPGHLECAVYAARACPFLSRPKMRRNEKDLPESSTDGIAFDRNPGVALVWTSSDWRPFRVPEEAVRRFGAGGGVLFNVGTPEAVRWFAHGRPATRAEVLESIETGLPLLRRMAEEDPRRQEALDELARRREAALQLVPAA